ncbi:MAG: hypothetical protein JSU01_19715 [Bacteroidetes bacterium]|nr:hypothetical protein [Bacteroidota bacterium]
MRKYQSLLLIVLTAIIATALYSCGGSSTKKSGDTTANKDTTKKAATTAAATTPFDVVDVIHTVKDYAKWRPVFDADSVNRKAAGMQVVALGRNADSVNSILVAVMVPDIAKAKAFMADPKLKAAMDKGGVISKPDAQFYHMIRMSGGPSKQWVVINHKVKDFNAWLKVFDGEGPAKRASEGYTDRALGRGIDDTTMVHLVFTVTDMAKAKAAIFSDDKKKLMESAGVIGKPDIRFYNQAQ